MQQSPGWRLLSYAVLLLYAALVIVTVLLFISNIGIAVLVAVMCVVLGIALWRLFTGGEKQRNIARVISVIAAAGLLAVLVYFLTDQQNRRALFIIAGLTLLYLGLLGMLRHKYWAERRQLGESSGKTARFKNPYLIINPKSGDGRAIKARIDKLAPKQGIKVIMTRKGVDIADIAKEAVHKGADVLGISGGDGSIGAVAKVAMDHNLPIVVLPGGTRCHFARDLGLDPEQIADSLAGFSGVERKIDVGEINGRIFLNNASLGLYADIIDNPDYRENKLQVSREVLQDVVSGKKKAYDLRFKHKDKSFKKAVQILVGVNSYNTMNLLELGQRDRLDEGVLQVTALTELSSRLASQLVKAVSIKGEVAGLHQWTGKTFTVNSAGKNLIVGVDGEREEYKTPVKIRIIPGALRIFVPAEGVRSRRKNPFNIKIIKKIWETARG